MLRSRRRTQRRAFGATKTSARGIFDAARLVQRRVVEFVSMSVQ
jgi:hypothetical protein